ncbi:MAG: hypothetical protein ACOH19_15885 [Rhodoglobus sp.]
MPQNDSESWITPPDPTIVSADDAFRGIDGATVVEFWQFALGDLRMNNARGYLAEFIVARALGLSDARRVEWAEWDVEFDGITIEVKSSAYLQSWEQRSLSKITFTGLKGTRYNPRSGYDPAGRQFNAMVYVFCVQMAQEHDSYDALDVSQWSFYVLPRRVLEQRGFASISLSALASLADASDVGGLKAAVVAAAQVSN